MRTTLFFLSSGGTDTSLLPSCRKKLSAGIKRNDTNGMLKMFWKIFLGNIRHRISAVGNRARRRGEKKARKNKKNHIGSNQIWRAGDMRPALLPLQAPCCSSWRAFAYFTAYIDLDFWETRCLSRNRILQAILLCQYSQQFCADLF